MILGLVIARPWEARASVATVAVAAADSSRASQDYAKDLLAQLGQLQSARPDSLQLVGADGRKRASLAFEVSGGSENQQARANVVLLDGKSGSLLWSKDFERPAAQLGDLRQELAYSAAQVLNCATEAYGSGRAKLETSILKLYLGGCAGLATSQEPTELIDIFQRVVRAEPAFEGGWTKLLVADADAFVRASQDAEAAARRRQELAQNIAAARKLHPKLVQGYLAEAALLPPNAFQLRMRLADRAVALAPGQSAPLVFRSETRFSTGDVNAAVDDARRATEVNPISPGVRGWYITILADSGRTEAALRELSAAERLWPDTTSQSFTRFRIHMRYGDPRIALDMLRARGWGPRDASCADCGGP